MNTKASPIRVALVGFGLIGQDRYRSLLALKEQGRPLEIVGAYDPYCPAEKRPTELTFFNCLKELYAVKPTWVMIAVPHDEAVILSKHALKEGCKVLVEKPLGRNLREAEALVAAAKPGQLWVGFNYRFFEGIATLIRDANDGKFGELVSVNLLMGHGCEPNITKGWKLDLAKAGGGCLIDPGIHLLDLCRLLPGTIEVVGGQSWNGFWKTGVEEESHLILKADKCVINLQVSIVRWRSTFRFEINGTDGYGVVTGRNRSYGPQHYISGPRWGWQQAESQAASEKTVLKSDGADVFTKEIDSLLFNAHSILPPADAEAALEDMRLLDRAQRCLGLPTHVKS